MSEFEFSTLGVLSLLLLGLVLYSYWQVSRVKRIQKHREVLSSPIVEDASLPITKITVKEGLERTVPFSQLEQDTPTHVTDTQEKEIQDNRVVVFEKPSTQDVLSDVQFFSQQDESEYAALTVFDPIMRFSAWLQAAQPAPIQGIDAVLDLILSQPKNSTDIEQALEDLTLDTNLPLRLYGRRSGDISASWQDLETGVLYSALRITLQLANASEYADAQMIQDWFVLIQRLNKRLAAHIHAWPDPAAMASYAVFLHDLAQQLTTPLVVQLYKANGLWPAFEVHQYMTQTGLILTEQGQYQAISEGSKVLYTVLNDVNNPRAQEFLKDALPTMHVNMLSFCLDLARVDEAYQPSARLWQDMQQIAAGLQAVWCNARGVILDEKALMTHAQAQISAYYQQLHELNITAGSVVLRRLLRG